MFVVLPFHSETTAVWSKRCVELGISRQGKRRWPFSWSSCPFHIIGWYFSPSALAGDWNNYPLIPRRASGWGRKHLTGSFPLTGTQREHSASWWITFCSLLNELLSAFVVLCRMGARTVSCWLKTSSWSTPGATAAPHRPRLTTSQPPPT